MIITVLCPICGKKIQIESTNDANICICCGQPFITSNAKPFEDDVITVVEPTKPQNTTADHYFNNIMGLLEKGVDEKDEALATNYNRFKTEYPLDERITICDYLIQYDKYHKAAKKSVSLIQDLLVKLSAIKDKALYEQYYTELLSEANELTHTDSNEMLNVKLYLGNFNLNGLKGEIATYNAAMKKYAQDLAMCEANLRTFEKNLDKHGSAVRSFLNKNNIPIPHDCYLNSLQLTPLKLDPTASSTDQEKELDRYAKDLERAVNKLFSYEKRLNSFNSYSYADFPFQPVCVRPIVSIRPYFSSDWLPYLHEATPLLQVEEYGIDAQYLYMQYKSLESADLSDYGEVKSLLNKIYTLLPQDIKNTIKKEEQKKKALLKK
ncbi:MAG: hypothetical protein J6S04_04480, partial [Clostridia bacterium]|nr:hypothetical protein [Clostridia bacterium]